MRRLKEFLGRLKAEYSKLSLAGIAVLIVSFIPDWQGRIEFWSKVLRSLIPHLASPGGRMILMVCGGLIIWLDHRRFLARHGKPHPASLQGRCLKVRDDMQSFLDSLGEKQKSFLEGETQVEYITRSSAETGRRWELLGHYYELNCASEVESIYHEFGVRGVHEVTLEKGELRSRKKEEDYKFIIEALSKLAETPEAKIKPRPALLR